MLERLRIREKARERAAAAAGGKCTCAREREERVKGKRSKRSLENHSDLRSFCHVEADQAVVRCFVVVLRCMASGVAWLAGQNGPERPAARGRDNWVLTFRVAFGRRSRRCTRMETMEPRVSLTFHSACVWDVVGAESLGSHRFPCSSVPHTTSVLA